MRTFLYRFPSTTKRIFRGYNLALQALAAILTYVFVTSGFDWFYFVSLRNSFLYLLFPVAAILGGVLPIVVPLVMLGVGKLRKSFRTMNAAFAIGQAGLLGLALSSFYKIFTGRIPPPHTLIASITDISREFQFGILRGGVFWGWPSSHTTVAFACASAVFMLYPKDGVVRSLASIYAFTIGVGASVSFHWFSECLAGAIIGTVIGVAVGASFAERYRTHVARSEV